VQADANPLLQLPGVNKDIVDRLINGSKQRKDGVDSFRALRTLSRDDAANLLKIISKGGAGAPIRPILDTLYSTPLVSVKDVQVIHSVDKISGSSTGTLKFTLEFQREVKQLKKRDENNSMSLSLVLGSLQNRFLLGHAAIQISRGGSWSVAKEIQFDWSVANADGGEGGGCMILRLLMEGVRGLDSELTVRLG
jgi:hypothetical protein